MRRMRPVRAHVALAVAVALCAGAAVGCAPPEGRPAPAMAGERSSDPETGRGLITQYGCGSCHRIPGIARADSLVGPPLDGWSRRSYIAGALLNNEANLVRWLRDPQEIEPGTAMPSLGLTESEAGHIAAYLATLR